MTALILGGSSLARRRVVPAFDRLGVTVDIASRTATWPAARTMPGRTFTDYADALRLSEASLVYVSTRNHEHAAWVGAAIDSGRHVVVDKPSAVSVSDVFALADLAVRRGCLLAEATVYPWHPQFTVLQRLVKTHGPVTRLMAMFSFPPLPTENFRHQAAFGGGALLDLGPYVVTPGRLLFGTDPTCFTVRTTMASGGEVESAISVLIQYPNDRVLVGHFGSTTAYVNQLQVIGPTLAVTLDRAFTTPAEAACSVRGQAGGAPIEMQTEPADAFALFLGAVRTAIAEGTHDAFRETMCRDARLLDQLRLSSRS
jgi:NDP-hexose-3-ketoreductase